MTDENTKARLKRLCKALGITVDDDLIADPEAHFAIYGQLCRVAEEWKKDRAILQAATRNSPTPYAYVYEWDYSPGVVHRSFSQAPYNGRRPDRTIQVFQAQKEDGND